MKSAHRPYRIIFMGTPQFAVPTLEALLASEEEIVAVVTQPDRPSGRGRILTAPPVKTLALATGLPVLQPKGIRSEDFLARIDEFRPDLLVVTAYGRILPGPLLSLPPLGTINVHASVLPAYRGAAPIQWAIIRGETETGITIMQMDEGLDTGDILLTGTIPIAPEDTTGTLAPKLAVLGGRLLVQAIGLLHQGSLTRQPQDNARATLAPPLGKDDGRIDWHRPAADIANLIRGLDPWPTAYTMLAGKRLRLFAPAVIEGRPTEQPGTLCRVDARGLLIATGRDYLLAREAQIEGSRRMAVESFLRGRPLAVGLSFDR
jgi:methionyl-tRNA formyltransferase